jgi:hypothetical protein
MAIAGAALFSLLASLSPYLITLFLLYFLSLAIYRLFFSPIAHIPGPKLGALTSLFEFYYDCVLVGQFYFQIQKLHKQYGMMIAKQLPLSFSALKAINLTCSGPIVRIGPNEVHIVDPEFFDRIYNVTSKLDKYDWFYNFANLRISSFGTIDADLHRLRRGPINKHFTPSSIIKMEPLIKDSTALLCRRLEEHRQAKKAVNIGMAFRCLVTDIVSEYVVPVAPTLLEDENFSADYLYVIRDFAVVAVYNRHIPWLIPMMQAMPRWMVSTISPPPAVRLYDNFKVC